MTRGIGSLEMSIDQLTYSSCDRISNDTMPSIRFFFPSEKRLCAYPANSPELLGNLYLASTEQVSLLSLTILPLCERIVRDSIENLLIEP